MPPTIGAAMRRMISEPVPLLHMIGSRPTVIAVTVIIFGRTRPALPSMIAACSSAVRGSRPSSAQRARSASQAWSR